MSREKFEYLWKAVRRRDEGLPHPPDHLSEPAYANLLFSDHCHVRACVMPSEVASSSDSDLMKFSELCEENQYGHSILEAFRSILHCMPEEDVSAFISSRFLRW